VLGLPNIFAKLAGVD